MTNVKAILIQANGNVSVVNLPSEDSYLTIRDFVGGTIDCVYGDDFVMYVHDEGLLIDLDPNIAASALVGRVIAGDVLLVGALNSKGVSDGENYDVPHRFLDSDFASAVLRISKNEDAVVIWHENKEQVLATGHVFVSWEEHESSQNA